MVVPPPRTAIPPILEIGGILISSEILTERFCCDYEKCKGICCVEGDAGAPVTMDEIADMEASLDTGGRTCRRRLSR